MRLGLLLCRRGKPAICSSLDIPAWVIDQWEFRNKYINQGELIAGVVLTVAYFEMMCDRDVLWFIDNTSAVSALIKAASPIEDNSKMALLTSLAFVGAGCRVWFEYVNTHQNPADPLSRGGLQDPVTVEQTQLGNWVPHEPVFDWLIMKDLSPKTIWEKVTALGGSLC